MTSIAANPARISTLQRRQCYALMRLARTLDTRFESLKLTGRVSKWYSAVGAEATTVPAGLMLEPGDALCTLHRDLGAILAVYLDLARLLPELWQDSTPPVPDRRPDPHLLLQTLVCQLLGKAEGFSNGVERSFHYGFIRPDQDILHLGMISHLGAMIPVAAGAAFALRQKGTDRVALNFIGEGGTSTGDFHEGLNMAAVWNLPLVLIIENNGYAFSTPASQQFRATRLSDRGEGYGIAAETVDGNDPVAVGEAVSRAVRRGRLGQGPTLIEAMLGRLRGHSEGDGSIDVVPEALRRQFLEEDPLPRAATRFEAEGLLTTAELKGLDAHIAALVDEVLEAALATPGPQAKTARRPVFEETPPRPIKPRPRETRVVTYLEAIRTALLEEMEEDSSVVLLGQDIGVFGGAFKATRGLYDRWPHRVLDTPIAESGTLGIAAGAALLGLRPVVELQFADFVSCGFNQIVNVIAKLFYRWRSPCPVVIRLPVGGGVGAGPFHSQNPEAWFAHSPGLKVVCPATARDAYELLRGAIRDPNPVVFCEHKYLYRRIKEPLPETPDLESLDRGKVVRPGADLTLVAYGGALWTCLEAAQALEASGFEVEVVDLRSLVPLDHETLLRSVQKTHRAIVVHEAPLTAGFGGEVAAYLADAAFAWLDAPVRRIGYPDRPVPYARVLEEELLPDVAAVLAASRELLAF